MSEAAQKLSLAPAAGTGIGAKLAERLLARPDFVPLLEDAAVAALTAMMPQRWDSNIKDWAPAQPDAKTRLAALLGLMAQFEGDPVKRIVHQHIQESGKLDFEKALLESPEMRGMVERALQKAEWRHSGNQAHKRPKRAEPVVEGEAGPAV